jgi:sugar-specific transcriptional regulator TrmB
MKTQFISEKELAVFMGLQKLGKSLVSEIAKETLFNRTALYHTLALLIDKGLVNEMKSNKVSYYEALSFDQYKIWGKRKIDELKADLSHIENVITDTSAENSTLRSSFKYYEGIEAIKNLYAETWRDNPKKEILAITDYDKAYKTLNNFLENEYFPDRVSRGIKVSSLLSKDKSGAKDVKRSKELLREMRFSDVLKNLGIEINIFSDSVAIFAFDEKKPTGVLIKNKLISEAFEKMFKFIWKNSKKS